jgi:hypothetical protein
MATSRHQHPSFRRVNLVGLPPDLEKQFALNEQRREIRQMQDGEYRRQCTGAYWRYASGIYSATGEATNLPPQFSIDQQPTQQLQMQTQAPRTTDKLAAYHEPCSDSFDIRSLALPLSLYDLLQSSIQAHARIPDAIRLNPFTVQLLKITEECCDGRYRGLIPLVADPQLDANTIGIDYL